jgi:hypothetical protein
LKTFTKNSSLLLGPKYLYWRTGRIHNIFLFYIKGFTHSFELIKPQTANRIQSQLIKVKANVMPWTRVGKSPKEDSLSVWRTSRPRHGVVCLLALDRWSLTHRAKECSPLNSNDKCKPDHQEGRDFELDHHHMPIHLENTSPPSTKHIHGDQLKGTKASETMPPSSGPKYWTEVLPIATT